MNLEEEFEILTNMQYFWSVKEDPFRGIDYDENKEYIDAKYPGVLKAVMDFELAREAVTAAINKYVVEVSDVLDA